MSRRCANCLRSGVGADYRAAFRAGELSRRTGSGSPSNQHTSRFVCWHSGPPGHRYPCDGPHLALPDLAGYRSVGLWRRAARRPAHLPSCQPGGARRWRPRSRSAGSGNRRTRRAWSPSSLRRCRFHHRPGLTTPAASTGPIGRADSNLAGTADARSPRRASAGRALAGLRGVVDGALAHVGEVPCGGREVLVVVEHNQVVLGCGGADQ